MLRSVEICFDVADCCSQRLWKKRQAETPDGQPEKQFKWIGDGLFDNMRADEWVAQLMGDGNAVCHTSVIAVCINMTYRG